MGLFSKKPSPEPEKKYVPHQDISLYVDAYFDQILADKICGPFRSKNNSEKASSHYMSWNSTPAPTYEDAINAEISMRRDLEAANTRKKRIKVIRKRLPEVIGMIADAIMDTKFDGESHYDDQTIKLFHALADRYHVPDVWALEVMENTARNYSLNKAAWEKSNGPDNPFPLDEP